MWACLPASRGLLVAKGDRILTWRLAAILTLPALLGLPACARAHVIPNDAKIELILKPEGQRLRLLVRVPLQTMVDLEYPTRGTSQDFVDLDRTDRVLNDAAGLWLVNNLEAYENNRLLPTPRIVDVRASLAFDGSFASYEQALAHVQGPRLTNTVDFIWNQGLLDVLLEYPIQSDRSQFSIYSKLSSLALSTTTSLRFLPPDGTMHTFEFTGNPDLIRLDPAWHQVAARFVKTGFQRILYGQDYWLFLLALAIPLRRWRALVPVVTAFAVAEAITLSPSSNLSLDTLWFQPLIGLLIAISIIYMAIENAMGAGVRWRWMIAFGFGLLLGFHFSFGLRPALQFAGAHAMTSLVAFGAGVAAGQIVVLLILVPAVTLLVRLLGERAAALLLSLVAGHVAWHWMVDRGTLLSRYPFQWPAGIPALLLVNWAIGVIIALAAFWVLWMTVGRTAAGESGAARAIASAEP
jgi:hypothetical protein